MSAKILCRNIRQEVKILSEQPFLRMLKFCLNWPIKLSNLISLYIALVVVQNGCVTYFV